MNFKRKETKKKEEKKEEVIEKTYDEGESFLISRKKMDPTSKDFDEGLKSGWFPVSVSKPYGEDWLLLFTRLSVPGQQVENDMKEFTFDGVPVKATTEAEAEAKYEQIKKLMEA